MENVLTGNGSDDGAGIYLGSVDSVVDGNHLIGNLRGIHSDAAGSNLIIRNTMSSNNTNLVLSANQKVAVVVLPPNSPAINGNTGAAGVGTTDPWANFRY
jgi:parallel beta-helix repeat protein